MNIKNHKSQLLEDIGCISSSKLLIDKYKSYINEISIEDYYLVAMKCKLSHNKLFEYLLNSVFNNKLNDKNLLKDYSIYILKSIIESNESIKSLNALKVILPFIKDKLNEIHEAFDYLDLNTHILFELDNLWFYPVLVDAGLSISHAGKRNSFRYVVGALHKSLDKITALKNIDDVNIVTHIPNYLWLMMFKERLIENKYKYESDYEELFKIRDFYKSTGVNVNYKDIFGNTPIHLLMSYSAPSFEGKHYDDLLTLIKSLDISFKEMNNFKETAFYLGVKNNYTSMLLAFSEYDLGYDEDTFSLWLFKDNELTPALDKIFCHAQASTFDALDMPFNFIDLKEENIEVKGEYLSHPLFKSLKRWFNNLPPEKKTILQDEAYKLFISSQKSTSQVVSNEDEEKNVVEKSVAVDTVIDKSEDEPIKVELYSVDAFKEFQKHINATKNHESTQNYYKKLTSGKYQSKTLSMAKPLFEKINTLYEGFPHFHEIVNHIENHLRLQMKGDKTFYIPPLLMAGGPGVGKTFFSYQLAELAQTYFYTFGMESVSNESVFRGTEGHWSTSSIGKILSILTEETRMNPILLLDEVDKARDSQNGTPMNAMLPLLESYTASKFKDDCAPLEIDASRIIWFATANDLNRISGPIKSRFDVFTVPNPNFSQRKSLIKGIYESTIRKNSWGSFFTEGISNETLSTLAHIMSPGASRDLRRVITTACAKAIKEDKNYITPHHISQLNMEKMPWDVIVETENNLLTNIIRQEE